MAAARKCDRCGVCFDPLEEKGEMARFINPAFQTAESIQKCVVHRRLLPGKDGMGRLSTEADPDRMIDLCPACTEEFVWFMKGPQVKKKGI